MPCALCFLASRQYSHGHLYLLCHPWGQEVLLVLGNLCHPGADKISTPNHPFFPPLQLWTTRPGSRMRPAVQSPSPAHSHAQRVEGTAGPGLPSLQHQPRWEPGGEAEGTMLGTAHGSLSRGWGRQRWTRWAASLTGLPGGPGSPCRKTGVTASPFPNRPLPPHWDPTLPSPSPLGGQPVLELPVARLETSGGRQCLGTCTQGMAAPGSTAPHRIPCLTSLPDGPGCPGAPVSPCRRRGRGRCVGFLPGWLLQGRIDITAPCTAAPAHLPSHPLGLAHHGLPAEQSKEGFREPSSLYITLPHRIHYPRALHHSVLSPIQDHWVVTAIPRHSHRVSVTPGLASAGLLWHHLTFSPVSPSSPGAPRSPWYRKSKGSEAAGPLEDNPEPFSPCQRHGRSVSLVLAPLTFLPCSPGGPRGPCKGE